MNNDSLIVCVQSAQAGDERAYSRLFNEYYQAIYGLALRETKNEETANDIAQETFIEIYKKIRDLKDPSAFLSWSKAIAYHQCSRFYKKKENKHEIATNEGEDAPSIFETLEEDYAEFLPEEAVESEEFKGTILGIIDALPETQRAAIMMYYYEEFSVKEIAEIQNVSENTVISRLNYGRKALKKSVNEYEKKSGLRLHAIPFFPLFKRLFEGSGSKASSAAVSSAAKAVSAATGAKIAAGAGLAAKIAAVPLAAKVVAGITAAVIVVSVPVVINGRDNKAEDNPPLASLSQSKEEEQQDKSELIPAGCEYHVNDVYETVLREGDKFPTPVTGDVYFDGAYEYHYNEYLVQREGTTFGDDWKLWNSDDALEGWGVRVINDLLVTYPDIAKSIAGKPIKRLDYTFLFCQNMQKAPQIPQTTESMKYAFYGNEQMVEARIIIPESVENMEATFMWCSSLTGEIIINATPKEYDACFWRTIERIVVLGGCGNIYDLSQTAGRGVAGGGDNIDYPQNIGSDPLYEFPEC